mgnify:FL=1
MKTKIILLTGLLSMTTATMIAQAININKTNNNMAEEVQVIKAPVENVDRTPVVFKQQENGFILAGILYHPRTWKQGEKL